jgi:hypothetical protein
LGNKPFHIDSNILKNKKANTKVVKKNNQKKTQKNAKFLFLLIIVVLLIGVAFLIKNFTEDLVKNFSDGKIIVCKDRLVSKELGYLYNKNENAFVNKKDGLFFNVYYCSNFDK